MYVFIITPLLYVAYLVDIANSVNLKIALYPKKVVNRIRKWEILI